MESTAWTQSSKEPVICSICLTPSSGRDAEVSVGGVSCWVAPYIGFIHL